MCAFAKLERALALLSMHLVSLVRFLLVELPPGTVIIVLVAAAARAKVVFLQSDILLSELEGLFDRRSLQQE